MVWYNPTTWFKKEEPKSNNASYEGSQLQKDIQNKLPEAKDATYQNSQLKQDVQQGTIVSRATGSNRDASYSSGGSVYNPATQTLDQQQKAPTRSTAISTGPPLPTSTQALRRYDDPYISAYQKPEGNAIYTYGQATKNFFGDVGYNLNVAFGSGSGSFKDPFKSLYYTEPVTERENIKVKYTEPFNVNAVRQTESNAFYSFDTTAEREGVGPFYSKYGETISVLGVSTFAPEVASGYLFTTGFNALAKGKNVEGVSRVVGGTIPFAIQAYNIGKPLGDVTKIRIEELNKAPVNFLGTSSATDTGMNYNIIARQTAYGAERTSVLNLQSIQLSDDAFSYSTSGYSQARVNDWWIGKDIISISKIGSAGRGTTADWFVSSPNFILTNPGITANYGWGVKADKTITTFLGNSISKVTAPEGFGFGGFSGTSDDVTGVISGNLKPGSNINLNLNSRGFLINTPDDIGSSISSGSKVSGFKNSGTDLKRIFPSGLVDQITTPSVNIPSSTSNVLTTNIPSDTLKTDIKPETINVNAFSDVRLDTRFKGSLSSKTDLVQDLERTNNRLGTTSGLIFAPPETITKTRTGTIPNVIPRITPTEDTQQITDVINIPPSIPLAPPIIPPYNFRIPPIIPFDFPGLDFSSTRTTRIFRGKQRLKYTPSYEALVFNIKGRMPKGIETGFRTRPIPKGYSFAYSSGFKFKAPKFKFKMPKFKF